MKFAVKLLFILLSVAYPFVVFWGIESDQKPWLLVLLSLLMISRICLAKGRLERLIAAAFLIAIFGIMLLAGVSEGLKFYPVVINLSLLFVFASSLMTGMPVIERIARIREPNLPSAAVVYTRQVTRAWCVFFVVNAGISAATVMCANAQIWLLYNGVIAYVLIAVMFSTEWLIRQRVRARLS